MSLRISVPSKTFLVGEYAALLGGPALLLNTEPRFVMEFGAGNFAPHAESPAGRFLNAVGGFPKLNFEDPHAGKGGFGASSAQFAALYAYSQFQDQRPLLHNELLRSYQGFSRPKAGRPPSGYDVVAQSLGGVAYVHSLAGAFESWGWNLPDLGFVLLRTGEKLATHDHLSELGDRDLISLSKISTSAVEAYSARQGGRFVEALGMFQSHLVSMGLQSPKALEMTESLRKDPRVLVAKGCGAMGADVILVLCDSADRANLASDLEEQGHWVSGTEQSLSEGLRLENEINESRELGL